MSYLVPLHSESTATYEFSHRAEGANGHLPNLDFINSASRILRHVGIPTLLRSSNPASPPSIFSYIPFASSSPQIAQYLHAAKNLFGQLAIGADGRIQGPEGCYGKYRIDAITWFAIPAEGPHGFHSIGQSVLVSFKFQKIFN